MEPQLLKSKRDIPVVHVIRGLTSFVIVLYHFCNFSDQRGPFFPVDSFIVKTTHDFFDAVTVFFFISGFILPWALFCSDYKIANYPRYFLKRIVRIHPPYFLSVLIFVSIIAGFQIYYNAPVDIEVKKLIAHFFYAIPFIDMEWFNVIYWTLAVEIQFYVIVGFIFPLLNSKNELIKYIPIIGLLIAGYFFPSHDFVTGYSIPFSAGMLFFLYFKTPTNLKFIPLLLCFALVAFQFYLFYFSPVRTIFLVTTIIMLMVNWPVNSWLNWLGETSYSLYLTHGFLGNWFIYNLKYRVEGTFWNVLILIDAIIISLIGARIFYYIIEHPSKKWASKIRYKRQVAKVSL